MDPALPLLAALLLWTPPTAAPTPVVWQPAEDFEQAIIRAQSLDSPYYNELPPPGGAGQYPGGAPQYPGGAGQPGGFSGSPPPFQPSPYPDPFGASPPFTPNPGVPQGGYPQPYSPQPYGGPGATDPFLGTSPNPGSITTYGAVGPQPYRYGFAPRLDVGYLTPSSVPGPLGAVDVFELNAALAYSTPTDGGNIFTLTPQYNLRALDGPDTPPGFPGVPNNLHRFGLDFEYAFPNIGGAPVSAELGFNPSINSDLEGSLSSTAYQYDARGALFFTASQQLTVVVGALYWDRLDDRVLPYAGVIYRPDDRWEFKLVFPQPQITYFLGHVGGKPTWVYTRLDYTIESYGVKAPNNFRNQMQIEDWRLVVGAKKDQGWGMTFLEAGYVFDRKVEFARTPGFDIGDALLLRGGVQF